MSDLFEKCRNLGIITKLKSENLYPFFRIVEGTKGTHVTFQGKDLVMMGSNNYLGMTHDPRVIRAAQEAMSQWGTGCTGSRFLNGNLKIHHELEDELADYIGVPAVVVFASGFLANLGAITAVAGPGDTIYCDKENHASILEACRTSAVPMRVYRHNNVKSLNSKLQSSSHEGGKLIVTDGVFSMNGHIAPIPEIHQLAREHKAKLYIDDAHGFGVIGPGGRGTAAHFGISADMMMGTFSKSFASQGGFITADREVAEWIKLKARAFMFSAALNPSSTAAALKVLRILRDEPEIVTRLHENAEYLRKGLNDLGLDTMNSETPIIPVRIGVDVRALEISQHLIQLGVFTTPVVFPACPKGQALIRMSVMATHDKSDLDKVLAAYEKIRDVIIAYNNEAGEASFTPYEELARTS